MALTDGDSCGSFVGRQLSMGWNVSFLFFWPPEDMQTQGFEYLHALLLVGGEFSILFPKETKPDRFSGKRGIGLVHDDGIPKSADNLISLAVNLPYETDPIGRFLRSLHVLPKQRMSSLSILVSISSTGLRKSFHNKIWAF